MGPRADCGLRGGVGRNPFVNQVPAARGEISDAQWWCRVSGTTLVEVLRARILELAEAGRAGREGLQARTQAQVVVKTTDAREGGEVER